MTSVRPMPSVLLVHGAFEETSVWAEVGRALRARAVDAVAIANPLAGLRQDAAYVASVAGGVDGPVLLVGLGYGGAVITAAGASAANVVALVYVAAFVPDAGESCVDLIRRSGDTRPMEALDPRVVRRDDAGPTVEATIRRDTFREVAADDLSGEDAAVLAAQQRAVAARALEEPLSAAGWRHLPVWHVVAADDRLVPATLQRWMAARAGGRVVELDASHAVARTMPDAVAEVIADAAGHVAR